MSSIEWMSLWIINGLGPIHEAASRLSGAPLFVQNAVMNEKQRAQAERKAQIQAEYRARKRLSSADRVANMMASVKGTV